MDSLVEYSRILQVKEVEHALRILLASFIGGIIGWERESKNRPAGLKTHMLTALAAATFTIVALELALWAPGHNATGDPIRAIEAVTAGVAFLAAGTIIQAKTQVIGLTTGASMWLAGALGVACGTGMYALAAMVTVLSVGILVVIGRLSSGP